MPPSRIQSAKRSAMDPAIALLQRWRDHYAEMLPIYHHLAQTEDGFSNQFNLCSVNVKAFEKAIKILEGSEVSFP